MIPLDGGGWHLEIPQGPQGHYRLAQLDDYSDLPRQDFPWNPPLAFSLSARTSSQVIPGTWGFGLWNDPFSLSFGMGGGTRRFPSLPNAAWFFFSSPQNYLSFQDHKPAHGFLAQTFQSPSIPTPILTLGTLLLPLLTWSKSARLLRKLMGRLIKEDSMHLISDTAQWHAYTLQWTSEHIIFSVDGIIAYKFGITPKACLGLVIWVDNQYASFPPDGRLSFGKLENPVPAWIEVKDIEVARETVIEMSTSASVS